MVELEGISEVILRLIAPRPYFSLGNRLSKEMISSVSSLPSLVWYWACCSSEEISGALLALTNIPIPEIPRFVFLV